MKIRFLTSIAIGILVTTGFSADAPFYKEATALKAFVISHEFPDVFELGPFDVRLTLKNLDKIALRGAVRVQFCEDRGGRGKTIASTGLELPPASVTSAGQDVSVTGILTREDVGKNLRVLLSTDRGEVVCHHAIVSAVGTAGVRTPRVPPPLRKGLPHSFRFLTSLSAAEGPDVAAFVENGGIAIVSPIGKADDFEGIDTFVLHSEAPVFVPQKGKANAYDASLQPGAAPLLDWPTPFSASQPLGDHRLRLPAAAAKLWSVVQRRNEPCTVALRRGDGLLILSTHGIPDLPVVRSNLLAHLRLEESGLRLLEFKHEYHSFDRELGTLPHPAQAGGKTTTRLQLAHPAATNISFALRLSVRSETGDSREFVERLKPGHKPDEKITLSVSVPSLDLSGRCIAKTELLDWGSDRTWTLDERTLNLPPFFEILPPAYRGVVSTRRARAAVRIGLTVNRKHPDVDGARWMLEAHDEQGAKVAEATGLFATGARTAEASLPIPADAPAGAYTLSARLTLPNGETVVAPAAAFRIVAPERGQILVDQDGFLLRNGEPYFPIGIYHCHSWEWNIPIDDTGLRARDMGFNWAQVWEWDWDNHFSLDRDTVAAFVPKNVTGDARERAIDGLLATNAVNREAVRGITLCYEGFGIWNDCIVERPGSDGYYSFERNAGIPRRIRTIAEDPDQLVGMWYVADEAGGAWYRQLSRATALFRANDPFFHPVFNLGCLSAVLAGDFGGEDVYLRYAGSLGAAKAFADRIDTMRRTYASYGRRPFVVPQAFGQSDRHPTETPAWVRLESYLAVIHGASGLGFYCWSQTGDWNGSARQGMRWNPPTAHAVKEVIAEIRVFEHALRVPGERRFESTDGNLHVLLCGDDTTGRFLLCANTKEGPVDSSILTHDVNPEKLEPLFGAPTPRPDGIQSFRVALPSFGTAVWRVR